VQAYNGQIAVDAKAQIIVAQGVTQCAADSGQLGPMIDAIEANLGRKPEQASADSGYCSEANLEARPSTPPTLRQKRRPQRQRSVLLTHRAPRKMLLPPPASRPCAKKIKSGGYASPYRLRKQLPEPVFGQIKEARGFRQFLMRGVEKVRAEFALVCTAHNPRGGVCLKR
jgi:hypothetical protein